MSKVGCDCFNHNSLPEWIPNRLLYIKAVTKSHDASAVGPPECVPRQNGIWWELTTLWRPEHIRRPKAFPNRFFRVLMVLNATREFPNRVINLNSTLLLFFSSSNFSAPIQQTSYRFCCFKLQKAFASCMHARCHEEQRRSRLSTFLMSGYDVGTSASILECGNHKGMRFL